MLAFTLLVLPPTGAVVSSFGVAFGVERGGDDTATAGDTAAVIDDSNVNDDDDDGGLLGDTRLGWGASNEGINIPLTALLLLVPPLLPIEEGALMALAAVGTALTGGVDGVITGVPVPTSDVVVLISGRWRFGADS